MFGRAILAGMLACSGCGVFNDPEPSDQQLSIIDIGQVQTFLATPDTVAAGSVTIHYNSYGSSSCNVPDGEMVSRSSGAATITAYDRYVPPQAVCTADMATYQRSVTLTLSAGTVELSLQGIRAPNNYQVGQLHKRIVVK